MTFKPFSFCKGTHIFLPSFTFGIGVLSTLNTERDRCHFWETDSDSQNPYVAWEKQKSRTSSRPTGTIHERAISSLSFLPQQNLSSRGKLKKSEHEFWRFFAIYRFSLVVTRYSYSKASSIIFWMIGLSDCRLCHAS